MSSPDLFVLQDFRQDTMYNELHKLEAVTPNCRPRCLQIHQGDPRDIKSVAGVLKQLLKTLSPNLARLTIKDVSPGRDQPVLAPELEAFLGRAISLESIRLEGLTLTESSGEHLAKALENSVSTLQEIIMERVTLRLGFFAKVKPAFHTVGSRSPLIRLVLKQYGRQGRIARGGAQALQTSMILDLCSMATTLEHLELTGLRLISSTSEKFCPADVTAMEQVSKMVQANHNLKQCRISECQLRA